MSVKGRVVIARKRRASYLPIGPTALGWLLADRFGMPGWGWGVFWTLIGILWVAVIYGIVTEEERDPFEGSP